MENNVIAVIFNIIAKTFGVTLKWSGSALSVQSFFGDAGIRLKWILSGILAFIIAAYEYLMKPVGGAELLNTSIFAFIAILIGMDACLGIWRTMTKKSSIACKDCDMMLKCVQKNRAFSKVSSNLLGRTFVKVLIYMGVMYIGFAIAHISNHNFFDIAFDSGGGLIITLIVLTEAISILENMACISMLYGVEIPMLGRLFGYFKTKASQILEEDQYDIADKEDNKGD